MMEGEWMIWCLFLRVVKKASTRSNTSQAETSGIKKLWGQNKAGYVRNRVAGADSARRRRANEV